MKRKESLNWGYKSGILSSTDWTLPLDQCHLKYIGVKHLSKIINHKDAHFKGQCNDIKHQHANLMLTFQIVDYIFSDE